MRASLTSAISMVVVALGLFAPNLFNVSHASAGTIFPGIFELFNHPDGSAVSLGPYGLRLDSLDPPDGLGPTYSIEADVNPVVLTWNLDDTAVIEGRILNNTTGEFWKVEYHLTDLTVFGNGFMAATGAGTLTYDDAGTPQPPIALVGTAMEHRRFVEANENRSESDWIRCKVEKGEFQGYGGAKNLSEIVDLFLAWAAREE